MVYNVYSKYNAYRLDQLDDDGNPKYPSDPTNLNLEPSQFNNTEKITGKNIFSFLKNFFDVSVILFLC